MSNCICSEGGKVPSDMHSEYCPKYMEWRIATLGQRNKELQQQVQLQKANAGGAYARIKELEAENNESLELLQKIRADLRMRAEPDPVGEGYVVNLGAGLWVRLKNYTSTEGEGDE